MRCDMKAFVEDGKVIISDERWVTIGGEDNDGSGQHVLIKENGNIVAGFGTGKNVKNAFGGGKVDTPEKANNAVAKKNAEKEVEKPKEYLRNKKCSYKKAESSIKNLVKSMGGNHEGRLDPDTMGFTFKGKMSKNKLYTAIRDRLLEEGYDADFYSNAGDVTKKPNPIYVANGKHSGVEIRIKKYSDDDAWYVETTEVY